jgi:hypothetical protein
VTDAGCNDDVNSYHERRLNEFRAAVAHREIAIAAAMDYCAQAGVSPPQWLTEAGADLISRLLKSEHVNAVGRSRGPIRRYRQEMIHVDRWFAVHAVRDIAANVRRDRKILRDEGRRFSKYLRQRYEFEIGRRSKWLSQGTFPCASLYLSGSESFAGPDAVRASYRKIERINANPAANQSCILENSFLEKLGIALDDRNSGMKLLHLFDLTI